MSGKMLERTRALMEAKREAVAADLLAWPKVEEAIRLAAAAGLKSVTIAPSPALAPIRLRHTSAAVAAVERLTHEQFPRCQWTEYRTLPGGPAGDQLEVEW